MLRYLAAAIILVHGMIHFMGFAKAFGYGNITQLTKHISKPAGMLWFAAAVLFIAAGILFLLKKDGWLIAASIAVIISQALIFTAWKDARFGSIANAVILFMAIAGWAESNFERRFTQDVKAQLRHTNAVRDEVITDEMLQHLPAPVQRYLNYCGVAGKPKVKNMRIRFSGQMRDKGKDWFNFTSVQYNFFDEPARLFFMKAKMFGITVPGYHPYQQAAARMEVKLFGLFTVMQAKGSEMNKSETVTFFNDLCIFAPAALVDKRITWTPVDSSSATATFTNGSSTIRATLFFNPEGQLVNFISDDRYTISDMQQHRFLTPVSNYKLMEGRNIPAYGEATWQYADGEFNYGKFHLQSIEYNVQEYRQ
jgi:hypothetical protein